MEPPLLIKKKSILKTKTNAKQTKKEKLQQYILEFDQKYHLNALESDSKIVPSYQMLKTSYQKKGAKLKKKVNSQIGLVGLKNMGNTCYVNSIVQLLSNLQPLSDYFLENFNLNEINASNKLSTKGRTAVAFANLIKSLWQLDIQKMTLKGIPVIIPEEFINVIQYTSVFGRQSQEDAQEFLMYLLDMIHEDLNRCSNPQNIELKEYSQIEDLMELERLAARSWGEYLQRAKSIIVDMMQGQIKNSLKCNECEHESFKFEASMYLSLPIAKHSLMDCLKEYLKEEHLSDDNLWNCEVCNKKVKSSKKIDLWKLPTVLVIHLKRFKFDNGFCKIDSPVEFPIDQLNLTGVLPKLQKEKPIYELLGVVCHSGTLNKGHYFTYARSKENFKWYLFNDKQVKEVLTTDIPRECVYVLMYGKSTIPLIKRQTLSYPDNWPHMIT